MSTTSELFLVLLHRWNEPRWWPVRPADTLWSLALFQSMVHGSTWKVSRSLERAQVSLLVSYSTAYRMEPTREEISSVLPESYEVDWTSGRFDRDGRTWTFSCARD